MRRTASWVQAEQLQNRANTGTNTEQGKHRDKYRTGRKQGQIQNRANTGTNTEQGEHRDNYRTGLLCGTGCLLDWNSVTPLYTHPHVSKSLAYKHKFPSHTPHSSANIQPCAIRNFRIWQLSEFSKCAPPSTDPKYYLPLSKNIASELCSEPHATNQNSYNIIARVSTFFSPVVCSGLFPSHSIQAVPISPIRLCRYITT